MRKNNAQILCGNRRVKNPFKKQVDCPHDDVRTLYVQPVTLEPKEGRCRQCDTAVFARTIWESREQVSARARAKMEKELE